MQPTIKHLLTRLVAQGDKIKQNLVWLLGGLSSCFLGLLLVVTAEFLFQQSLTQEVVAFIGLLFIVLGGLFAIAGFISLSVLRLLRFLQDGP